MDPNKSWTSRQAKRNYARFLVALASCAMVIRGILYVSEKNTSLGMLMLGLYAVVITIIALLALCFTWTNHTAQ